MRVLVRPHDSTRRRWFCTVVIAGGLVSAGSIAASTTFDDDPDLAAGTLVQTDVDSGVVSLATDGVGVPDPSIPWWDPDWGQRRCVEVTNSESATLTEYQIAVDLDTATLIAGGRMEAGGDDLRAVSSDGSTLLDYWIEGPIDDAATRIWVQTDSLPTGASTFCLYYDNPAAPALSDPLTPFTYDAPQPLYVAVSTNQTGRAAAVVSYVDGNEISDGTTSLTLAAGGTTVLPGATHTGATVVSATGPLALRGVGSEVDTYVPIAFSGTTFVLPTTRSTNRVSVYAPFGTASVSVSHSGTTTPITVPAGTSVTATVDVTSNADAAIVTSDVPVLVTHTASNSTDAFVAVPAANEPLYGIRSTQHLTGFGIDGSAVAITESDGGSVGASGDAGDQVGRTGGGSQGTGPAVLVTPTSGGDIAAIQQADSDGGESSSYWPASELNVMYRVATASQYIAMACPSQATGSLSVAGVVTDCTGTGGASHPGKARATALAAGALVESLDGEPFHLYAEDSASNDEANVLGPKQARLATANPPTHTVGAEESRYLPSGTWTSATVDTGCEAFFDAVSWSPTSQPSGTSIEVQLATSASATGPFAFVGPDGSAGTSYVVAAGEALASLHADDRFFQVRAALTSTDGLLTPTLDALTVNWEGQGSLSGRLFADDDANGSFGGGDAGIGGAEVELWRDDGDLSFDAGVDTLVTSESSAGDGTFEFATLRPGTYFVRADEGDLDTAHLIGPTTPNPSGPITVDECAEATVDLGFEFGAVIEATTFSDLDGSGTLDGADVLLGDVEVDLWLDDGDGAFDRSMDTLVEVASDPSGTVMFPVAPAGSYFVVVAAGNEPAGHDPEATTANPSALITVDAGDDAAVSIGFAGSTAISGTVVDADDRALGLGGVFVSLHVDDGDGVFDSSTDRLVSATLAGDDGTFEFDGLAAGGYFVVPGAPPAGYLTGSAVFEATAPLTDSSVIVPLQRARSLGGRVIADDDGIVDPSTQPLGGVAIALHLDDGDGVFDGDDVAAGATATASDGTYRFEGLAPGNYFIVADLGGSFLSTLTEFTSPNPIGPVAAGTDGHVFVVAPLDLTLPATGSESWTSAAIAAALLLAGLALVGISRRPRPNA